MKKSIVSCLVLIFVLFVVSSRAIFSQEPIIYVDFPTYESINISIEPEMKISVSYPFKIDSSCLNPLGAMYESNWDSTYNRYIVTPIDIIFSDYYDGNDSTLDIAKMMGSSCSSILINDTVFKCIPNRFLEYETEYGISFDDLRVYNSITGDTLVLDTIISPLFTTTQPMYSVKNISSNGNSIRTGDTITV